MTRARIAIACLAPIVIAMSPILLWAQEALEKQMFRVKYIAQGVVYLEGGRAAGLKEGQNLLVERVVAPAVADGATASPPPPSGIIASLKVVSVAASSAVCEIVSYTEPVAVGDMARFAPEQLREEREAEKKEKIVGGRPYPQVITFTSGDPAADEARASVPRPPSPEINRMRGRIGVEYETLLSHSNPSSVSSDVGVVARFDMTRIAGSYWNFSGYYRGRFTSLSGGSQPVTITDLINRTYHLALTYDNPNSAWLAGVGRMYLPWAASLDTIDGGYVARREGDHTIVGVFGGSTPDPTSYDYNPNQRLVGTFVNFQGGDWDGIRYTTTFGVALAAIDWRATRQFVFAETGIFINRKFSIYDSMQIDAPHTVVTDPTTAPPTIAKTGGLNQSYLTLRYQPNAHLELSLSDIYFRNVPTFDPALIGTGLLDRYLFQGLSGGVRVNLPKRISFYTEQGQSSRTGDSRSSWNQMYGMTVGEIGRTGFRADVRYSKFNSLFGSGDYEAISLSRPLGDRFQFNLQGGIQRLSSTLTTTTQTHFVTTYVDWTPGRSVFFETGYTWQRGGTTNYDQLQFIVGKRF